MSNAGPQDNQQACPADTADDSTVSSHVTPSDELEPQLKYERLGADVKDILQHTSATCLCLSEKVLALGTSSGNIHILDYSGNEVCCAAVCRLLCSGPIAAVEAACSSAFWSLHCPQYRIISSPLFAAQHIKCLLMSLFY
jgi:hypothetical protein